MYKNYNDLKSDQLLNSNDCAKPQNVKYYITSVTCNIFFLKKASTWQQMQPIGNQLTFYFLLFLTYPFVVKSSAAELTNVSSVSLQLAMWLIYVTHCSRGLCGTVFFRSCREKRLSAGMLDTGRTQATLASRGTAHWAHEKRTLHAVAKVSTIITTFHAAINRDSLHYSDCMFCMGIIVNLTRQKLLIISKWKPGTDNKAQNYVTI